MQRFAIFVLVGEIISTMLSESWLGILVLLTIIDTTVGTIRFVLGNNGEIILRGYPETLSLHYYKITQHPCGDETPDDHNE